MEFALYTYTFTLSRDSLKMTDEQHLKPQPNRQAAFERRMDYLRELLSGDYDSLQKGEDGWLSIPKSKKKVRKHEHTARPDGELAVLGVSVGRGIKLKTTPLSDDEEDATSYETCHIIIDMRRGDIQQFAIEKNTSKFGSTTTRANEFCSALNNLLAEVGLKIEISPRHTIDEFWSAVDRHPRGFKSLSLKLPPPNDPEVTKGFNDFAFSNYRDIFGCAMKVCFESSGTDPLHLSKQSLATVRLAKAASGLVGGSVVFKSMDGATVTLDKDATLTITMQPDTMKKLSEATRDQDNAKVIELFTELKTALNNVL